ncbi:MAG: type IV secretion protein Rhs [Nitrospira sp. CG24A]|nr:MAG: type IV secretion protein Rhs [Nitrospira sp. CG24A]
MRQLNGVFPAVVIDNVDPENLGRIQVQLPQLDESGQRGSKVWARMATLMAGKNRGTWFIPDAEDEVLIAFEAGDVRRPYVIGSLWNGTSSPPETMDANNNKKLLRSRNGVTITLDDQSGQERFIVETPGGQKVTLKDGPGSIEIRDSNGNSVTLEAAGITVKMGSRLVIIHCEDGPRAAESRTRAGYVHVWVASSSENDRVGHAGLPRGWRPVHVKS